MAVNETSLAAYWSEKLNHRIGNQCAIVLDSLVVHGPGTRAELATRTGFPINVICGRVRELVLSGLAKQSHKVTDETTLKEVWVIEAEVLK